MRRSAEPDDGRGDRHVSLLRDSLPIPGREAVPPPTLDARREGRPRRRDPDDPRLDGRRGDETGRLAEGLAHRLARMRVPPLLCLRGGCHDRLRRRPLADGHEREAHGGPSTRLLLEDLGPAVRGLPDAGIQAAPRLQGPLRHRRDAPRLSVPQCGGRRGRGDADRPGGGRRPSTGAAERPRGHDRGRADDDRREGYGVPARARLVRYVRVSRAQLSDLSGRCVRRGDPGGDSASERRFRRVRERGDPRHFPPMRPLSSRAPCPRSRPGRRRSWGTSRPPGRSPTRTPDTESWRPAPPYGSAGYKIEPASSGIFEQLRLTFLRRGLRGGPRRRSLSRLLPERLDTLFEIGGRERLAARLSDENLLPQLLPQEVELLVHLPFLPSSAVEVRLVPRVLRDEHDDPSC